MNNETINPEQILVRIEALDSIDPSFSTDLMAIRKALGLSCDELARLVGRNRTTILRWEIPNPKRKPLGQKKMNNLKTALNQILSGKPNSPFRLRDLEGRVTFSLQAKCSGSDVATKIFTMFTSVAEQVVLMEFKESWLKITGIKKDGTADFVRFSNNILELCTVTSVNIQ